MKKLLEAIQQNLQKTLSEKVELLSDIDTMKNTCHRMHICLTMVKAYDTSKIGKKKYCEKKKLNVHQAASYVIARRGQGFFDKCVA